MPQINETLYAPAMDGGEWVQHGPVNLRDLRGQAVVLIDFWDYTCVNCLGTLPYVAGWHERYARHGLVVAGVHAPEFSFARDRANVFRRKFLQRRVDGSRERVVFFEQKNTTLRNIRRFGTTGHLREISDLSEYDKA